jgi:acetyl-CoA acyltransferase
MADSLWVIGASMTKFMRYPDKDLIDLGSEAALAALGDAGLTIFDTDILTAGCLFDTSGVGQRIQKQIGQAPCTSWRKPLPDAPDQPGP